MLTERPKNPDAEQKNENPKWVELIQKGDFGLLYMIKDPNVIAEVCRKGEYAGTNAVWWLFKLAMEVHPDYVENYYHHPAALVLCTWLEAGLITAQTLAAAPQEGSFENLNSLYLLAMGEGWSKKLKTKFLLECLEKKLITKEALNERNYKRENFVWKLAEDNYVEVIQKLLDNDLISSRQLKEPEDEDDEYVGIPENVLLYRPHIVDKLLARKVITKQDVAYSATCVSHQAVHETLEKEIQIKNNNKNIARFLKQWSSHLDFTQTVQQAFNILLEEKEEKNVVNRFDKVIDIIKRCGDDGAVKKRQEFIAHRLLQEIKLYAEAGDENTIKFIAASIDVHQDFFRRDESWHISAIWRAKAKSVYESLNEKVGKCLEEARFYASRRKEVN